MVGVGDPAHLLLRHEIEADVVLRALALAQAAAPGTLDPGAVVPAMDEHVGHGPTFFQHSLARLHDLPQPLGRDARPWNVHGWRSFALSPAGQCRAPACRALFHFENFPPVLSGT
jgi:hypothetical protein